MRPSVASASPRSRYSRNGRRPLRVHSAPSIRDSTILGFSSDMVPPVARQTPAGACGGPRLRASSGDKAISVAHDDGAQNPPPPGRKTDGRESRQAVPLGAPSFAASSPAPLSRRARAARPRPQRVVGAGGLAQPADQAHGSADGGRRRRHDGAAHRAAPQRPARPAGGGGEPG